MNIPHTPSVSRRASLSWLSFVAALFSLLGSLSSAQADTLVVLMDLPGRHGKANRKALVEAMNKNGTLEIQSQTWFQQRASDLSFDPKSVLSYPDLIRETARGPLPDSPRVDIVVQTAKHNARSITFQIHNAATGQQTSTVQHKLFAGKLPPKQAQALAEKLLASFQGLGWDNLPEEPKPEKITPPPKVTPPVKTVPSPTEDLARPNTKLPLVHLQAGPRFFQRDFTAASPNETLAYASSFYPGFHLGLTSYPLASSANGAWWGNFGLVGHFARGFDSVTVEDESSNETLSIAHSDISGGLVFAGHPTESFQLRAGLGADFVDFVLDENVFYSSTTYRALWLGARGAYRLVDSFETALRIRVWPSAGLGDSQAEFGETSSTFGFSFGLSAQYELSDLLDLQFAYTFQRATSSFSGTSLRPRLEGAQTVDIINDLALLIGARF